MLYVLSLFSLLCVALFFYACRLVFSRCLRGRCSFRSSLSFSSFLVMSRVIINIPDSYPRVEGIVEVFSPFAGSKLPYMNAYLDRDLFPGDVVEITLHDPFSHIESVGSIKTPCGEVIPVINCK